MVLWVFFAGGGGANREGRREEGRWEEFFLFHFFCRFGVLEFWGEGLRLGLWGGGEISRLCDTIMYRWGFFLFFGGGEREGVLGIGVFFGIEGLVG